MNSDLFKLSLNDWIQAIAAAVVAPVVISFYQMFQTCGFMSSCYNWDDLGKIAVGSFIGFIATKFFSDSQGRIAGIGK